MAFIEKTSRFLKSKKPFFFVVNFDKSKAHAYTYEEAKKEGILFDINGQTNIEESPNATPADIPPIEVDPFPFLSYLEGFEESGPKT